MKKYQDFKKIQEVRRGKKCPVLSFKPIRDSEIYKDMIGMGFLEMLPPSAETALGTRAITVTAEETHFKDKLGNIAFFHPDFEGPKQNYPQYNIMHNGSIRVVTGPSKTSEFPRLSTDLKRTCMTVEDYLYKMNFLVKYLIRYQGFPVTDTELYNDESYKTLIDRKMKADPSVIKSIKVLPSSLAQTDFGKGARALKRFGAFGED